MPRGRPFNFSAFQLTGILWGASVFDVCAVNYARTTGTHYLRKTYMNGAIRRPGSAVQWKQRAAATAKMPA